MSNQIHWFPGHMKKALDEISLKIKLVDVVIELFDARAPNASVNEFLEKFIQNKKRLIVISKIDLADSKQTQKWEMFFKEKCDEVLSLDLSNPKSRKIIASSVVKLAKAKHEKEISRGMKPQPIKTMIIGIPNVGKSSLINRFANRKAAGVQNKPGFTKGEQWIKINNDFMLLDTPGVLPMNYEDKEKATKLALIGSIKEEILPTNELAIFLLSFLKKYYPNALKNRFGIDKIKDDESTLLAIATARGLLTSKGEKDLSKAEILLLKEFKDGKLGRITLDLI